MRERIARALFEDWVAEDHLNEYCSWEELQDKLTWLGRADAVLAALEEPTSMMVEAGREVDIRALRTVGSIWTAMLTAAREGGEG